MAIRNYGLVTVANGNIPGHQLDDPARGQFVLPSSFNTRARTNLNRGQSTIGDAGIVKRGTKSIIWSSEGYTSELNQVVPALTATQKKTTGTHAINIGAAGALPIFSAERLALVFVFTSLTGSGSITLELDELDDAGTPNVLPLWNSGALVTGTSAEKLLINVGAGLPLAQAAAAPNAAATGFTSFAGITGWSIVNVPVPLLPNGQLTWTISGTVTATSWSAILYGVS